MLFISGFVCEQVEQNRVKLINDRAVAKSQLQKKLGQFLYLTNLEKVTNQFEDFDHLYYLLGFLKQYKTFFLHEHIFLTFSFDPYNQKDSFFSTGLLS